MTWLTNWYYRKSITLARASGAVTSYQMKLLVGESSGATGEDVDCGGNCLSSFNDLRFTTSDGTTLLDYWIESISGTTPNQLATVWIEFNSIGTNDTTFYMYYGNSGASAYSNGTNTFLYFQNFNSLNDGDLNGQDLWSGSTDFDIQTSVKYEGAKAIGISTGGTSANIARNISVTSYNMFVQMHLYTTDASQQFSIGFYTYQGSSHISGMCIDAYGIKHLINPPSWQEITSATSTTWYKCRLAFDSASTHKIWVDDMLQTPASNANMNNVTTNIDTLKLEQYIDSTASGYIDQIFIGQYLATEPAWGTWGSEESGPDLLGDRYWIGDTGLWTDTAHWSDTSGGAGGASVPSSVNDVHFDSNSFTTSGQHIEFS